MALFGMAFVGLPILGGGQEAVGAQAAEMPTALATSQAVTAAPPSSESAVVQSLSPLSGAAEPSRSPPAAVRSSGIPPTTVRPALPLRLEIPAIHVDAPMEYVGVTVGGAMDAPHEWGDVAWFDLGVRPGEAGNAVIAGHLDSTTGPAVFWNLGKLRAGDLVYVRLADGSQRTFSVTGSEVYPSNQAPLQRILGPGRQPMLNLVTCDGTFDRQQKAYDKRLVVYTSEK